ncbi:MAG: LysM peptidoglycan-binding domain-containing protein [Burkholderiaceae bacterium]|nr:LysM peptidoglycan-binding domain-containing protein [Burkholderiaceae bacterium]
MVAIISSSNLGLADSSQTNLGLTQGDPTVGRSKEQAWVNVATGNLVMQQQDEFLVGKGPDATVLRTYNSQGVTDGDNNDNWRIGFYRQIKTLTGTVNTAGSSVVRVDKDGAELLYTYDTTLNRYIRKDGSGSFDTMTYDGNGGNLKWAWTDGATRATESYDWTSGVGKLQEAKDADGNKVTYTYNSGLLTSVTNASGEQTLLDYTGNNLTKVRVLNAGGTTLSTRTRYAYDASNRLTSVTVDLSPEDNAVTDGKTYVTNYTYDGTSNRVASIAQTGGALITFAYTQVGASYRVSSMVQTSDVGVTRTTSFSYDTANSSTTVIDPLGNATVYTLDFNGRLTNVLAPAVGGVSQSTSYTYKSDGTLATMTDARGNTTTYSYDGSGNLTLSRDAMGNTVTQAWDANNQLISRTTWLTPDPDGAGAGQAATPQITRYAYDSESHLRYEISAAGRVTERRYNSPGQLTASIIYTGNLYTTAGTPTEANLTSWLGTIDKSQSERTDYTYEAVRGQLDKVTTYTSVDSAGVGVTSTASSTQYVYDQAGQLLKTTTPKGVATTAISTDYITQYFMDGLGRTTKTIDTLGNITLTSWDDANNKTVTTLASGLAVTNTYNKAGELLSRVENGKYVFNLTTSYDYDKDGQVRRVIDPNLGTTYRLYDAAGRQVGGIDALGVLTEYLYNNSDQVVKTVGYATAVSSANLSALAADISAGTNTMTLATVRPAANANDGATWTLYDNAGRPAKQINELGYVTETQYDGADQVVAELRYTNALTSANLAALTTSTLPTDANAVPPSASTAFSRTRYFYDADGNQAATLSPVGTLTENLYDAGGHLTRSTVYANPAISGQWDSGTLAQLRPSANTNDNITRYQYDDAGQLIFEADALGGVTGYTYDANGNVSQTRIYATAIASSALPSSVAADAARDAITRTVYDSNDRPTYVADPTGAVTGYVYDTIGNVTRQTAYANLVSSSASPDTVTANASLDEVTRSIYDVAGRLTWQADLAGSVTKYVYDFNGNVVSSTAYGNTVSASTVPNAVVADASRDQVTTNVYNAANQLTYTSNGVGAVTGYTYDADGRVLSEKAYANTVASGTPPSSVSGNATSDRLTQYTYDAAGRQTQVTLPPVDVYQPESNAALLSNGATGIAARTETTLTLTTQDYYDALGNVVASRDTSGNLSFKVWDAAQHQVWGIDSEGYATAYAYDTQGNATSATCYANKVADATRAGWGTQPPSAQTLAGLVVASSADRMVITDYDALGRVLRTTDPKVFNAFSDGTTLSTNPVTEYTYDALGRLQSSRAKTSLTGWATTYHYYDTLNRETATIDAMGFVTTRSYDAFGNVTQTKEYATAATTWSATTYTLPTTSTADRNTTCTYDLDNRKTGETQVDVDYSDTTSSNGVTLYKDSNYSNTSTALGAGLYTLTGLGIGNDEVSSLRVTSGWQVTLYENSDFTGRTLVVTADTSYVGNTFNDMVSAVAITNSVRGNLSQSFAYDSFGNLIRQTDAAGNVSRTYYDKANRVKAVAAAATNVQTNTTYVPLTEYQRNAFGDITQQAARAQSAVDLTNTTYNVASDAADRVSTVSYDRWGDATDMTDAMGNHQYFSYDKAGRVAKQWQGVTVGDPNVWLGSHASTQFHVFQYDRMGKLAHKIEASPSGSGVTDTQVQYNAFGEVTARGVVGVGNGWSETMEYDNAGRLWRTNAGDGTAKVMLYDLRGKATVVLTSPDTDLRDASIRSASQANGLAGTLRTTYTQDALGRITKEVLPNGAAINRTYDRWGNLLSLSDARDATWITNYTYDASNHLLKETAAASGSTQPVTQYYYDKAGNQVAVRHARNNVNQSTWDNAGHVLVETHADGGVVNHSLNVFGDEVERTDAMGNFTSYTWDKLDHMTQITRASALMADAATPGTNAVTLFTASNFGGESMSLGPGLHNMDATFNDNVQSLQVAAGWKVMLFQDVNAQGHAFSGASTFADLNVVRCPGTFSDWSRVVSSILVERDDNATIATSVAATTISKAYDAAGRLLSSTDGAGQITAYGYDRGGNVRWVLQPGTVVTESAYDALGRKTWEEFANKTTSSTYDYFGHVLTRNDLDNSQDTYTYDNVGRLVAQSNTLGSSVAYTYDAMGHATTITDTTKTGTTTVTSASRTTQYTYDLAGNRTSEKTTIGGTLYQDVNLQYDRLGRLTYAGKPGGDVYYEYDLVGNRTRVHNYANGSWEDGYYAFDAMNRVILVRGAVDSNPNNPQNFVANQGRRVFYDKNGNRTVEKTGDYANNVEAYSYDALGRLLNTTLNGSLIGVRRYDEADRLVWLRSKDAAGDPWNDTINQYNSKGQLVYQTFQKGGANNYQVINSYDAAGNLSQSVRGVHVDAIDYYTSTNDYVNTPTDEYRVTQITATRSDNLNDPDVTTLYYDLNGQLVSVTDQDKSANNRQFFNTVDGVILQKTQQGNVATNVVGNGHVLGSFGHGVDVNNPTDSDGNPNYIQLRDFNVAYQEIDEAHPGAGPGSYQVKAGDTLAAIATAAYGDAQLWYLIADANGLRGDADLSVGRMITLPNTVGTVHSDATTFKRYDSTTIIGDTSPSVNANGHSKCFQIGIIILSVLAALIITVATSGMASAASAMIIEAAVAGEVAYSVTAAALITSGCAALGGAAGGALGSMATQGIMVGAGLQAKMNWADVGTAALTGFLTAGSPSAARALLAKAAGKSTTFLGTLVRGTLADGKTVLSGGVRLARTLMTSAGNGALSVTNDAIGQGIRMAGHKQSAFNWRGSVAAAATGALGSFGNDFFRNKSQIRFMQTPLHEWKQMTLGFGLRVGAAAIGNVVVNKGQFDDVKFTGAAVASLGSASRKFGSNLTKARGENAGRSYQDWREARFDRAMQARYALSQLPAAELAPARAPFDFVQMNAQMALMRQGLPQ